MNEPEKTTAPGIDLHRLVRPAFGPGEIVSHITDDSSRGVIVAFMVRGRNHSYQVQWGVDKEQWHLDFELKRMPEPLKPIGFWSEDGQS